MLEVCVDTIQAAIAAERAGAQRIELCTALDVGGVTPPTSLVEAVCRHIRCPLVVLVRPRSGDFLYDAHDYQLSLAAIRELVTCNVSGLAVGGLMVGGELDTSLLRAVRELVPPSIELVMHRAFDFVHDQDVALETLVALRFNRVLTSGGACGSAAQNVSALGNLIQQAGNRITILPAGGINRFNAPTIVKETGCTQLHGSFRIPANAQSDDRSSFGRRGEIDSEAIGEVRQLLDAHAT